MKYLNQTFTIPVSNGLSQEDWDTIWKVQEEAKESFRHPYDLEGWRDTKFTSTGSTELDWFKANDDGA